jgi:hypothetical protein
MIVRFTHSLPTASTDVLSFGINECIFQDNIWPSLSDFSLAFTYYALNIHLSILLNLWQTDSVALQDGRFVELIRLGCLLLSRCDLHLLHRRFALLHASLSMFRKVVLASAIFALFW